MSDSPATGGGSVEPGLRRTVGLFHLTFYGLGTILGAGIYVLVGKVSLSAGALAPLSFLVAGAVAWVTALSYSRMVAWMPRSAGPAAWVEAVFGRPWLTLLTGYLIIAAGAISSATLATGFVGYFQEFLPVDARWGATAVVLLLGGVAMWGIRESMHLLAAITIVEVCGLLLVLFHGGYLLLQVPDNLGRFFVPGDLAEVFSVGAGAFLAFYAFIGFEDMANVAEEVKDPARTMPRAILMVMIVSGALYLSVALVAMLALPLDRLQASGAPMSEVLRERHPGAASLVAMISIFAILNGVLVQIIMASRVLYGMASQGRAPAMFSRISATTRTPIRATLAVMGIVLVAALALPLVTLAQITSLVVLVVFALVNLSLLWLVRRGAWPRDRGHRAYPLLGLSLCLLLLFAQLFY